MSPTELADALHANATIVPDVTGVMVPVALLLDASHALRRLGRVEEAAAAHMLAVEPVCDHRDTICYGGCATEQTLRDALRTP